MHPELFGQEFSNSPWHLCSGPSSPHVDLVQAPERLFPLRTTLGHPVREGQWILRERADSRIHRIHDAGAAHYSRLGASLKTIGERSPDLPTEDFLMGEHRCLTVGSAEAHDGPELLVEPDRDSGRTSTKRARTITRPGPGDLEALRRTTGLRR